MAKRSEADKQKFMHWNYAHRGLYTKDQSIPENSLAAFRRAAEKGYGVELDVQLSDDGQVMVFHDDNLKRMCGKDEKIWNLTFDELRELNLADTDEKIPLFSEVLQVLKDNEGPLIVELKNGPRNDELCMKTALLLQDYPGTFCIESFNPFIVNWFRGQIPEIFRGQLASGYESYSRYPKFFAKMLYAGRFSFINKPDFIAYNHQYPIPKHIQKLRKKGALLVAWTSRDPEQAEEVQNNFDAVIFEHYEPASKY